MDKTGWRDEILENWEKNDPEFVAMRWARGNLEGALDCAEKDASELYHAWKMEGRTHDQAMEYVMAETWYLKPIFPKEDSEPEASE